MRLLSFIFLIGLALATATQAEPRVYTLNPEHTRVEFTWFYGDMPITGTIPISNAQVVIDFQDQTNSAISAVLDATGMHAGIVFATRALTGPKMFNTKKWPQITFDSVAVDQRGTYADVTGNLNLRGADRRVRMRAELFKQQGAEDGDLSRLAIRIRSTFDRRDFGAGGWRDKVGPEVKLEIRAYLNAEG